MGFNGIQGPHYESSPITGKAIFSGVVPIEFLFLNSFTFIKNAKHDVESS